MFYGLTKLDKVFPKWFNPTMKTINVIEYNDDNGIISVRSFLDDANGNKEAEKIFTACAIENGAKSENIQAHIEDGYFRKMDGYEVYLAHSI